ncbi:polysaccharide deacetylase family protein [Roseiarcaceae bacterium H3SJ34-1]|uniref:polysaccharide deacetylase family protein n=1 Tax=Terripilifer ovatus TaxID=3032367 RepID=UPI003AB99C4A|nr:polysaccharide deacetylase family protein [Roseiarcaceae bacterium H3SJ34-1]
MPGNRTPGMDHKHYGWSALPDRPPLRWPNGASVALCVVVNLEHYDLEPVAGSVTPASMPGGRGRGPSPDIATYSLREYGNRVGVFRVIRALEKHGIKPTVAIDAATAVRCPAIVRECLAHGYEFAGHGQSATQAITSAMSEAQERTHIRQALDVVRAATGKEVTGWLGPEYSESARTPAILADLGVTHVFDWPNDEQPYEMSVLNGRLVALPTLLELDDVYAHWHRRVAIWRWEQMVKDAFDRLAVDGRSSGRLMVLSLHPWLIGQPHRIRSLDGALAHMAQSPDVWMATGSMITEWFTCHHAAR